MTESDVLLEYLTVEYRLFTQKNGKAPDQLIINKDQEHRYGGAVFERFKSEVAPNCKLTISEYSPSGSMFFLRDPGIMLMPMKRYSGY